ncbi:hypothetical protein J31TS4_30030 [Paenibacillus sp. J31TS4]|uniref:DUF421 domain-containing protein n=1 Tax=Paenibacillus sp. J31TS4 TaxID=2807195 RepID=UPI001B1D22AE|nr:YetF domain-containing protein [Paenibacillus sp. J31TS4]GIP39723.1 hypothetical protein J31TS4_30030 [Paenibacillus sp. J31TS4]
MQWAWIWKSVLLLLAGMALLRIAGRKSISQMTVATTVIVISIGTTIVQPIANNHMSIAVGSAFVFILSLLVVEYLQVKFPWIERCVTGQSKVVIENGKPLDSNLRTMRMTVDQLESQLRLLGISNIQDVKTATLEPNGQLGYELMPHAKPVTMGDLERLLGLKQGELPSSSSSALFEELQSSHSKPIDPRLQ